MQKTFVKSLLSIVAVFVISPISQCSASIIEVSDRSVFDSLSPPTVTVDFEGIAGGFDVYQGSSFTMSGITFEDNVGRMFILDKNFYGISFPSDYLNENDFSISLSIEMTPPAGTTAFGFDYGSLNTTFGSLGATTVEVTDGSGTYITAIVPPAEGSLAFIGFLSDSTITSIKVIDLGGFFVLDNVSAGPAIATTPEPSSIALLAIGGLGAAAGAYRRRRQTKTTA